MERITEREAMALLCEATVVHVGVIADGEPYVTPMTFVSDGRTLHFRTGPGRRLRAIEGGSRVALETFRLDDAGEWLSVTAIGQAVIEDDEETVSIVTEQLFTKYKRFVGDAASDGGIRPVMGDATVVRVDLDGISGLTSGRLIQPRTRPGRL